MHELLKFPLASHLTEMTTVKCNYITWPERRKQWFFVKSPDGYPRLGERHGVDTKEKGTHSASLVLAAGHRGKEYKIVFPNKQKCQEPAQ